MNRIAIAVLPFLASLSTLACSPTSLLPHHDHTSRSGGMVLMNGDTHFEVAVGFDGRHAVLFSDEFREPLPADRILEATLTVLRPGAPETLALRPTDERGTWTAAGSPIADADIEVRVSFRERGKDTYTIDLPVQAPAGGRIAHSHAR